MFCNQFQSSALAMAILRQCQPCEEMESFDIVMMASQSAQETLAIHQHFLKIFDDGKIDGFELNETKKKTASGVSWFHRLEKVVEDAYHRRRAA